MADKVYRRKLTDLVPDAKNANAGTERGLRLLDDSLQQDGAGRGILLDKNNNVIAGNKTIERAVDLGYEEIIVVPTDGKQLVATQRIDVDLDTPQGRRMAIRDNRVAEIDLAWDADALRAIQDDGVDLSQFWHEDELAALLGNDGGEAPGDPGAAISRAEEWRDKWQVEKGQLWLIGRHRLFCGSAYDTAAIERLLDGKKPDMLHIDPPYGIGIVKPLAGESAADSGGAKPFGKTGAPGNRAIPDRAVGATGETKRHGANAIAERNSVGSANTPHANGARSVANIYPTMKGDTGSTRRSRHADANGILSTHDVGRVAPANIIQSNVYPVIEGDDTPFDPALFVDYAPVVVMWGANYYADKLPISSCWICWDKREDITRNNFADGELAWTNQDKPMRIFHHLWNGLHKGSQHGERRLHPTEKPVALFAEIGGMFAPQGLWLDLFAGSGPQLVAAEQNGATCYAAEIEPLYVATIIERLAGMGLEAKRIG